MGPSRDCSHRSMHTPPPSHTSSPISSHLQVTTSTNYAFETMALETATGAFAAVGVADVLIRVGRDVYSFLCNIADAHSDLKRLNEHINDTLLLAENSKKCLQELSKGSQTTATKSIVNSLCTTLRALNRELQSLSKLIAKYKKNRPWDSIKYALDRRKAAKALESLERTKSSLASNLTLACRSVERPYLFWEYHASGSTCDK